MMKRKFDLFKALWKRSYLVDDAGGDAGAGSGGGGTGGDAGAGGDQGGAGGDKGAGSGAGAGGGAATGGATDDSAAIRAENERLKKENEDYRGFHDRVSADVEFDEAGKVRLKAQKTEELTDEEKRQAEISRREAEGVVRGDKHDRDARAAVAKDKAGDPLFDENMAEAEKFMQGVAVGQQSKERWAYAYSMAAGMKLSKYEKIAEERGRKAAMEEFARNQGITPPGGEGGEEGSESADDYRKIILSKEQIRAANIQISSGGSIKTLDDYKRNLRSMGLA